MKIYDAILELNPANLLVMKRKVILCLVVVVVVLFHVLLMNETGADENEIAH